ncbi:hypothetical protein Tco_0060286 [Tanacetum coccineum]
MEEQKDEDKTVIRNKARLVAKGYAQEEGIVFRGFHLATVAAWKLFGFLSHMLHTNPTIPMRYLSSTKAEVRLYKVRLGCIVGLDLEFEFGKGFKSRLGEREN